MTTIGTNISNSWELQQAQQTNQTGGTTSTGVLPLVEEPTQNSNTLAPQQATSTPTTPKTNRSITQLRDAISGILKEHGIDPNEAMKTGVLEKISGRNTEYLLNAPDSEIKQYVKCLELALNFTPKKADGTADIDSVIKAGNDYHIALQTGWDIEDLDNINNGESVLEKLQRFYPNKDLSDPKQLQSALEGYFNQWFNEKTAEINNKDISPGEKARLIEREKKLQLQDFGKMLINTPDSEKEILIDALKHLYHDNKLNGFESIMESVQSAETRTQLADKAGDPRFLIELFQGEDRLGETATSEQQVEFIHSVASEQSRDGLIKSHEVAEDLKTAFETANTDALKALEEKLAEIKKMEISQEEKEKLIAERLTDEEKKLLAEKLFYTNLTSGHLSGTANNINFDDETKTFLLNKFNYDAFQHDDYQEVMENIANFVKEHSKSLNITVEEFEKLLNDATNGNYETIAKGLDRPLVEPELKEIKPITTTAKTENTVGLEVVTPKLNDKQKNKLEKSVDRILEQTQREAKIIANKEGTSINSSATAQALITNRNKLVIGILAKSGYSFTETISKTGCSVKEGIAYACENHDDLPRAFVDRAKETFKDFTEDEQVEFIVNNGTAAFNLLFSEMSAEAIFKLQDQKDGMLHDLQQKIDIVAEQRRKELKKEEPLE